jgi:hypothetical protein
VEWRYYTTKDDAGDVHSFYLDKMPENGWEKVMEMTAGQVVYSMWQKDDGNIGAWIGAGEGEKKGQTMIWMWRGQGLANEKEIEEEEPEETEEASSPEPSPTSTPVNPVSYTALIGFLPHAPDGWEAEEPRGATMTALDWAWSQASCDYRHEDTGNEVSVLIVDSAYQHSIPLYLSYNMHFEYESSGGYGKTLTYKGLHAYETYNAPDNYQRTIGVADRFLVIVTADTKESLEEFCGLMDYSGLALLK